VDDADSWLLLAFLVCLVLSAFFSSAESAFISLPKLRIRYLVEIGVKRAEQLAKAAEKPERFLATVLLGNNLVNVAAATLGTILAVAAFGAIKGPIIAVVGVTAILLVFGEVIPKTLAVHHAQRLALAYINLIRAIEWCFTPLSWRWVVLVWDSLKW
jgi:Putative Mg2+ and Co2+ transporter CorB